MTITIEIAPELRDELARQAATQGLGIDAYAAGLLEIAAHGPGASPSNKHQSAPLAADAVEAIERLKSFGKTHRLSLGGMTIRELRHEARP
jgi:hypothetical protein